MLNYREETEVFNSIPIQEVASWIGLKLPRTGSSLCPFPDHQEKTHLLRLKNLAFGGVAIAVIDTVER